MIGLSDVFGFWSVGLLCTGTLEPGYGDTCNALANRAWSTVREAMIKVEKRQKKSLPALFFS